MNKIRDIKKLCFSALKVIVGLLFFTVAGLAFIFPAKCDSLMDKYVGGLTGAYGSAIYTNVKSNMRQILLCQMAYHSDRGKYLNCPPNPKNVPGKEALPWETGHHYNSWKELGFELKAAAYYQYRVTNAGRDTFRAIAKGDRNGNGVYHIITITEKGIINEINAGE